MATTVHWIAVEMDFDPENVMSVLILLRICLSWLSIHFSFPGFHRPLRLSGSSKIAFLAWCTVVSMRTSDNDCTNVGIDNVLNESSNDGFGTFALL